MKVTVVGSGGVGGYFGGRLVQAGVDVTFVARGPHLEALAVNGLRVRSVLGDFHVWVEVTEDLASSGAADYVLVSVKSFDTDGVAAMLGPIVGTDTAVVSLQNGVDNEERLAAVLGDERVVGGAAYIFATIAEPGVIDHTGGPARLTLGEWRGGSSERVAALVEMFRAADVTADESSNIRAVLWSKFAFIVAQAAVTAAVRLPIGEIRSHPASRALFRNLVDDVCAVAAAEGIELPADLPDKTLAFADGLEPGSGSSLHHDLIHGRRMELDTLLGEVVRRGERQGLDVPTSKAMYGVLQPWAARAAPAQT